jgi:hypothetical protein
MKNFVTSFVILGVSILFTGCGGGGGGSFSASSSSSGGSSVGMRSISGTVEDGPIKNARVFIDLDFSGDFSDGDVATMTDKDGKFSLDYVYEKGTNYLIAFEGSPEFNTTDPKDHKGKKLDFLMFKKIDGNTINITPLVYRDFLKEINGSVDIQSDLLSDESNKTALFDIYFKDSNGTNTHKNIFKNYVTYIKLKNTTKAYEKLLGSDGDIVIVTKDSDTDINSSLFNDTTTPVVYGDIIVAKKVKKTTPDEAKKNAKSSEYYEYIKNIQSGNDTAPEFFSRALVPSLIMSMDEKILVFLGSNNGDKSYSIAVTGYDTILEIPNYSYLRKNNMQVLCGADISAFNSNGKRENNVSMPGTIKDTRAKDIHETNLKLLRYQSGEWVEGKIEQNLSNEGFKFSSKFTLTPYVLVKENALMSSKKIIKGISSIENPVIIAYGENNEILDIATKDDIDFVTEEVTFKLLPTKMTRALPQISSIKIVSKSLSKLNGSDKNYIELKANGGKFAFVTDTFNPLPKEMKSAVSKKINSDELSSMSYDIGSDLLKPYYFFSHDENTTKALELIKSAYENGKVDGNDTEFSWNETMYDDDVYGKYTIKTDNASNTITATYQKIRKEDNGQEEIEGTYRTVFKFSDKKMTKTVNVSYPDGEEENGQKTISYDCHKSDENSTCSFVYDDTTGYDGSKDHESSGSEAYFYKHDLHYKGVILFNVKENSLKSLKADLSNYSYKSGHIGQVRDFIIKNAYLNIQDSGSKLSSYGEYKVYTDEYGYVEGRYNIDKNSSFTVKGQEFALKFYDGEKLYHEDENKTVVAQYDATKKQVKIDTYIKSGSKVISDGNQTLASFEFKNGNLNIAYINATDWTWSYNEPAILKNIVLTGHSKEVEEAVRILKNIDPKNDNIEDKLSSAKAKLQNEKNADVQTAKALFEVAEVVNNSCVEGIVKFDENHVPNYSDILPKVIFVADSDLDDLVDNIENPNNVSGCTTEILNDLAKKLKSASDKLEQSYHKPGYTFNYDGTTLSRADEKLLRASILAVASKLKFISAYKYGDDKYYKEGKIKYAYENDVNTTYEADYLPLTIEYSKVLNSGTFFVFDKSSRLDEAKEYLLSSAKIVKDLNESDYDAKDRDDIKEAKNYATKIITNFENENKPLIVEDDEGNTTVNLVALYDPSRGLQISDFGSDFAYKCKYFDYNEVMSKREGEPFCGSNWWENGDDVYIVYPKTKPTTSSSNIDDIIISAYDDHEQKLKSGSEWIDEFNEKIDEELTKYDKKFSYDLLEGSGFYYVTKGNGDNISDSIGMIYFHHDGTRDLYVYRNSDFKYLNNAYYYIDENDQLIINSSKTVTVKLIDNKSMKQEVTIDGKKATRWFFLTKKEALEFAQKMGIDTETNSQ